MYGHRDKMKRRMMAMAVSYAMNIHLEVVAGGRCGVEAMGSRARETEGEA